MGQKGTRAQASSLDCPALPEPALLLASNVPHSQCQKQTFAAEASEARTGSTGVQGAWVLHLVNILLLTF
jgi:hypothetical protein